MSFINFMIGGLVKLIGELPDSVTGRKAWLKDYFDGNAKQIRDAHDGLVQYLENNVPTRTEVDNRITERIVATGNGDMVKAVYDPDDDGVVVAAERAEMAETAGTATTAGSAGNGLWLYRCTLAVDSWNGVQAPFTQTVSCEPVDGGPAMTGNTMTTPPEFNAAGLPFETIAALQGSLGALLKGSRVPGAGVMTFSVPEKPGTEIEIFMRGRDYHG